MVNLHIDLLSTEQIEETKSLHKDSQNDILLLKGKVGPALVQGVQTKILLYSFIIYAWSYSSLSFFGTNFFFYCIL